VGRRQFTERRSMPLGRPNIRGCLDTGRKTPRSGQSARACRAETRFQQASRTADPARRAANSATLGDLPGAIALALTVVLPLTAAPGPASRPGPPSPLVSITLSPARPASTDVLAAAARLLRQRAAHLHLPSTQAPGLRAGRRADRARSRSGAAQGPRHDPVEPVDQPHPRLPGGRPYLREAVLASSRRCWGMT
jgi:hypothetical protein